MPLSCAFFMLSTLCILCNSLNRNVAMAFITTTLQIRKQTKMSNYFTQYYFTQYYNTQYYFTARWENHGVNQIDLV